MTEKEFITRSKLLDEKLKTLSPEEIESEEIQKEIQLIFLECLEIMKKVTEEKSHHSP